MPLARGMLDLNQTGKDQTKTKVWKAPAEDFLLGAQPLANSAPCARNRTSELAFAPVRKQGQAGLPALLQEAAASKD